MLLTLALVIIAYLMGSLSSAIIFCKMAGLPDPRMQGSGNPGATNVLRFGGKKLAIIVLIGDALKGVLPVLLAKILGLTSLGLSCVALAAFLGHLFPLFFGFRGGKGVATGLGVMLALAWQVGLFAIVVWLSVAALFRYSSLASLLSAVLASILACFICNLEIALALILMNIFLIARHYENIERLLRGQETKLGAKS